MLIHFYRIVADGGDGEEYIGSTQRILSDRWSEHKSSFRAGTQKANSKILFEKYGIDKCRIELIEVRECQTLEERKFREAELVCTSLNCVNKCIPGRTQKQRYEETKPPITRIKLTHEQRKEKMRAYYQTHKEQIIANVNRWRARQREHRNELN